MKLLTLTVSLVLVACNNQPVANAAKESATAVEARMAAALKLQPGNWAMSFRIVTMDMTGTKNPKAAEAIEQALAAHGAQANEYENCISSAQVAKPLEILFAGTDMTGCIYDSVIVANGKMTAKMTCKRGKGMATRTMTGTYSPTTYAFTTDMTGDGTNEATALTMKTQSSAKRVGACPVDVKNTV